MLKECIDRIVELARPSHVPAVIRAPAEPEHVYYIASADGKLVRYEAESEPRDHQFLSLETLPRFLEATEQTDCEVWYSRERLTVLLDANRRDRLTYHLALSPQLKLLQHLEKTLVRKSQADFLKMLRINLHNCLATTGSLMESLRVLNFRQASEAAGVVQHGKASLGKKIEAELTGAGSIPDTVVLEVPIFENLLLPSQHLKCAIDIDPAAETFALIPLAGEIETAIRLAEAVIEARLTDLLSEATIAYGMV